MLILTAANANQVRGLTVRGHALAPRPLADGTFALPEAVLNDPYHAVHRDYLIANADVRLDGNISPGTPSLPNNPSSPLIGSDWSQDPIVIAANTFSSDWPIGAVVIVAAQSII